MAERLSGTGVEFVLNSLDVGGDEGREVGAFWEVPAHEAVGVFVQAPLPGMIMLGEVDLSAKPGCYLSVAGELLAIVISDGFDLVAIGKRATSQAFWTEAALLSASMASFVYLDLRSAWVRIASLELRAMMVSPSQSPMRRSSWAMAGRSAMSTRPEIRPRPEFLPLRLLYSLSPWRRWHQRPKDTMPCPCRAILGVGFISGTVLVAGDDAIQPRNRQ